MTDEGAAPPRAKYEGERWSNGWPAPTFASFDDDGDLSFEWCFGKQAAPDSWRVMLCIGADETSASTTCRTPLGIGVVTSSQIGFAAVIQQVADWLAEA